MKINIKEECKAIRKRTNVDRYIDLSYYEVVGNIFENTELLK